MYNFCYLFLLFVVYSFLGWVMEVINVYVHDKKFVNRGFMIGPYCPIYAMGALLIINFLKDYTNNILVLFILSMFICMSLEYFISFIMEKLFNARWWDYSNRRFNINGRICLETTIPFGICGVVVMYIINPMFTSILDKLPKSLVTIIGCILLVMMLTDLIISLIVVSKFKNIDFSKVKDDTEEISKRVREYLISHSILTRRLFNSFPGFKIRIDKFREKIDR